MQQRAPRQPFDDEPSIEKALDFLRDSAGAIAEARGRMVKAGAMLSHIEALEIMASDQPSDAKKKADARSSESYLDAIKEQALATSEYEKLRSLREAATMRIEAWRSWAANHRGMKV